MMLRSTTLWLALCASPALAGEIELEIAGCTPNKAVLVALYDNAQSFDAGEPAALWRQIVIASGNSVHLNFPGLPAGRYAIAAFEDDNGNRRLDRNSVGMPLEPYGFSRDARRLFGAPDFEQAAFELGNGSVSEIIHLK